MPLISRNPDCRAATPPKPARPQKATTLTFRQRAMLPRPVSIPHSLSMPARQSFALSSGRTGSNDRGTVMSARIPSAISGEELRFRLRVIGLGQATFARRVGLSWRHVHRYLIGSISVPAFVHRVLLCEEVIFALKQLTQTTADRVGKRRMIEILNAASEPITTVVKPPKKRVRKGRKINYLAPRFLGKVTPPPDELPGPLAWQEFAARVGQAEADRLHAKLSRRRPPTIGRPTDDGPPPGRVTDPI